MKKSTTTKKGTKMRRDAKSEIKEKPITSCACVGKNMTARKKDCLVNGGWKKGRRSRPQAPPQNRNYRCKEQPTAQGERHKKEKKKKGQPKRVF